MPSRIRSVLLACLLIGACECDDTGPPARASQTSTPAAPSEPPPSNLPPPEGTPLEPEALMKFAPDALAGFTANGPAEPKKAQLPNGGTLVWLHRQYHRGEQKLQLEVSDSLHAPGVREVVLAQQGQQRKTANSEI